MDGRKYMYSKLLHNSILYFLYIRLHIGIYSLLR